MTKGTKIAIGLVVVAILLYALAHGGADHDKHQSWNRSETPGGAPAVGLFGMDWGQGVWPWIIMAAVAWFWYSGDGDVLEGSLNLLDTITGRGARVTHYPINDVGIVDADPQAIADEAGVSLEVYALARNIASEEPHSDPTTKAAIGWCGMNEASRRGQSVSQVLLKAKRRAANGRFGSQSDKDPSSSNYLGSDRYATTALDPYDAEITIAQGIFDGTIPDLTNGAQQYDREAGEKNPEAVAAKRYAAGAELVDVPGADPGLRFWRT